MPLPRLMLGNGPDDSVAPGFQGAGDCVFAMISNAIRLANAVAGNPTVPIDGKQAIAAYSEVTGYVLDDESTDQGTDMHTALDWWRTRGFADATGRRHTLDAYVTLDLGNLTEELEALYLFDVGIAVGVVVSPNMQEEFAEGKPWTETGQTEEGHAILLDGRREYLKFESWARDQEASGAWFKAQADEVYGLLDLEASKEQ